MTEEGKLLYEEAISASKELDAILSDIAIIIPSSNEKIIESILKIFGKEYILDNGDAKLTYAMYKSVVNLIRELGSLSSNEVLQ